MMFAIYFKNPNNGEYIPCTSSRHMYFVEGAQPTLFAQFKNAEKALRDYARVISQYPNQRVYRASISRVGGQVPNITTEQLDEWESNYPDGYSEARWTKILYEYDTYQMAEEALATFIAMESEDTTEVKYYDRTAKRA